MDNQLQNIPYFAHEGMMSRNERTIKRLIVSLIVAVVMIFASNLVWLYAWMQYDYTSSATTENVDIDGKDGIANYIGNDGDINNGADKSDAGTQD